jgi:ATP-binding cassette subfamily B protein
MNNIRRFLRIARSSGKGVTRRFVVSQLFLLGMVICNLLIPQMIQTIADEGIARQDLDIVVNTALRMMLFAFISALLQILNAGYAVGFSVRVAHGLRTRLYAKIQTLSFGNLDRFQTSDLLVRLTNDVNVFKQMIMLVTAFFFMAPLMLTGSVILTWLTTPQLLWIMALVLVVMALVLVLYSSKAQSLYRVMQERLDQLNAVLQENLAGVRVVKAFARSTHEMQRFEQRNTNLRDAAKKPMLLMAFLMPTFLLIITLGMAAGLWFGGNLAVSSGTVTVGEIMTFANYLVMAMIPLALVAFVLPQIAAAEASIARIFAVFDSAPDIQEKPNARSLPDVKGRVVFENVSLSYLGEDGRPSDRAVLKNIDLTAEPGQMVAILGATGSGKSSLTHLIPRFYDVTEGRVTIDGVDVRDLKLADLRQHVGIALQQAILFSGTVRDNVRYGRPEANEDEVFAVAQAADAHGFVSAQVDGYDSAVAREGANFSGGQRQRISIARALAIKPKILILDDSTSAVDVATETRIQAALGEMLHDTTTFVVAQRISTVLIADKIIVLDNGEIVAEGTHDELVISSPIYREISESQLGGLEA